MDKIKLAVLVSGGGTNLQAIIDNINAGKMPHCEIAVVISNVAGAYALERAKINNIPAVTIKKKKGQQAEFEAALKAEIASHGAEIIVLAGFLSILSQDFTDAYPQRIINVHPSLIPSFCGKGYYGLRVHEEALARGVKVTGATVHFVNEIPDGGQIIMQRAVYVEDGDTPESLQKRVMEQAEWIILPQSVEMTAEKMINERND